MKPDRDRGPWKRRCEAHTGRSTLSHRSADRDKEKPRLGSRGFLRRTEGTGAGGLEGPSVHRIKHGTDVGAQFGCCFQSPVKCDLIAEKAGILPKWADCRDGDMTAGDPRIVDLRAKVRDERALLAELSARVSPDIQKLLKPASNLLETCYLTTWRAFSLRPKCCGIHRETSNKWPNGWAMPATYCGGRLSTASK